MNPHIRRNGAIGILWLVHISAIIGVSLGYQEWFISKTPLNLLIIALLVIAVFPVKTAGNALIFGAIFIAGFLAEWIGVHSGFPFGSYTYGSNLGFKFDEIPFMIGANWAVLVFATGAIASVIFNNTFTRVVGGAAMMVLLDLFMEPVAPVFDYWTFEGGEAPLQNYVGWMAVAILLHLLFQKKIGKGDVKFSLHVYGAQLVFFVYFFLQYGL